ncbi:MAG: methyltransferase domain-containing protein [Acidobacteriota bacterium]
MLPPGRKIERVSAREGYDLWSETYDSTPNPVVSMDSRHTSKALSAQGGELILDAGCGTGRHLRQLLSAGTMPIGIDFAPGMLKVAHRHYPNAPLALADLERPLPFKPGTFDAALCALIGEHLSDLGAVSREFYLVLKPGGRLVFSVYHPQMSAAGIEANFEQEGVEYRLGAFHYTVREHVDIFEDAGFVDVEVREFTGDEELAASVHAAAKYLGFPVLLVLTARKS